MHRNDDITALDQAAITRQRLLPCHTADTSFSDSPKPVLGLREAIAIIVGVVIGAGIFKAPSMVAMFADSPEVMFGAWLLGGVISLIGALCYAELATAYPHAGGDYHFLQRAYGRPVSLLFGWARRCVITTGSGFSAMVEFTAPVFWLFFLLSGVSLFVLRWREPERERPYRVPFYPVLPIIFCGVCAFMLWSSVVLHAIWRMWRGSNLVVSMPPGSAWRCWGLARYRCGWQDSDLAT